LDMGVYCSRLADYRDFFTHYNRHFGIRQIFKPGLKNNYMSFFNRKINWWIIILISIAFGCLIMLLEIFLV
jgi:hypothetical protein